MKKKHTLSLATFCVGALMASAGVQAAFPPPPPDCPSDPTNRYCLPRNYESEISAAEAYLKGVANQRNWGHEHGHGNKVKGKHPVIIDVRSIPEYAAGHPEGAHNIPYPFIYQYCDSQGRSPDGACIGHLTPDQRIWQEDAILVAAVEKAVPDKDTPIYTLCRTGHRSVLAANILTAAGYTHVRNIWQGFVGQYKVDYYGDTPLDLNHDNQYTDADKDGWRYYQGLPYSTKLKPRLLYKPYVYLYYE
jgi:rhodanese-related sulfurtransferase